MKRRLYASAAALLAGCAVGPNYQRPALDMPAQYRDVAPAASSAAAAAGDTSPLGERGWWEVYSDSNLQTLLTAALKNNYDVKIAVAHIDEARRE